MDILNAEGTLISVETINGTPFLKVKNRKHNTYTYFPINKPLFRLYFEGKLTLREIIPDVTSYVFIDKYYDEIEQGMKENEPEDILHSI